MRNVRALAVLAILFNTLAGPTPAHAVLAEPVAFPAVAQGHPGCAGVTYETPQTPECTAVMATQPYPDVTPVPYDLGVIAG